MNAQVIQLVVAVAGLSFLLGFTSALACATWINRKIDRGMRLPFYNYGIITCIFELAACIAVTAARGPSTGHWAQGTQIAFTCTGSSCSKERTGSQYNLIGGIVRGHPRF